LPSSYRTPKEGYTDTGAQQFFYFCVYTLPRERVYRVYLATKGGIHFTDPMISKDRRNVHRDTQTERGAFMKYATQMGSFTMIHKASFIKIGSGVQKLIGLS
jgi:hypothetical protein